MITLHHSTKRAYYALKNLYEIARNYRVIQNTSITEDNQIYRVELLEDSTKNRIIVIWEVEAEDNMVEIKHEGKEFHILNLYGEELQANLNEDMIMINPDVSPVYIILKQ